MFDVVIDISSRIVSADDTENININTLGHMRLSHGTASLFYSEKTDDGQKVSTTVKIGDDKSVNITRTGDGSSQLTVLEGRRCLSSYNTPYGTLTMGISGRTVDINLDENGGQIVLDYAVDINSEFMSNNLIEINVRRLSTDV